MPRFIQASTKHGSAIIVALLRSSPATPVATVNDIDMRTISGFSLGTILWPLLNEGPYVVWDPCPVGLPEILEGSLCISTVDTTAETIPVSWTGCF